MWAVRAFNILSRSTFLGRYGGKRDACPGAVPQTFEAFNVT